jgi:2-desacetyl-2-hydroxyethyl bacteriochlorophyllide A dehydrogenase
MGSVAQERRRVFVSAVDVVAVTREPVPELSGNDLLVRMSLCGVCGSDKAGTAGKHAFFGPPYYPGHEVVGEVVAAADIDGRKLLGRRVTIEPTLVCGHCKQCRNQRENLCENLEFFGCGYREGGMAELFSVPLSRAHLVPEELTDLEAVLIEPLATPVHAVRMAGEVAGRTVAVLGAGTIGLLTLLAARHAGARRIVSTDVLGSKRDLALALGADAAIDAASDDLATAVRDELGESADVVFDCVSTESTVGSALRMAVKGGTVVVVGGPRAWTSVNLPVLQEYEVRLQGSATYTKTDFERSIALLGDGAVDASRLITSVYPLDQAKEAFAAIAAGGEVKIVVMPSQGKAPS